MRIDIITLFPEICRAPLNESIMKRAQENGALDLHIHNLRDWTSDKHHVVDDAPWRRAGDGDETGTYFRRGGRFAKSNFKHQTSNIQVYFDVAHRAPFRSKNGRTVFTRIASHYRLWALRGRRSSSS